MFQSFDTTSTPEHGAARLANLRAQMQDAQLDGFIIPRADAHQGEYVAPRDQRLAWLTGFTGSAKRSAPAMARRSGLASAQRSGSASARASAAACSSSRQAR